MCLVWTYVRIAVDSCSKFTLPFSKAVLEQTFTRRAILSYIFIDVAVIDVGCSVSSPSTRSGNRHPGMAKWRGFAQSSSRIPYQFWESGPGLAKGSSICRRESQYVDTLHRLQLAIRKNPPPKKGLSRLHFCYPGCSYRLRWPRAVDVAFVDRWVSYGTHQTWTAFSGSSPYLAPQARLQFDDSAQVIAF